MPLWTLNCRCRHGEGLFGACYGCACSFLQDSGRPAKRRCPQCGDTIDSSEAFKRPTEAPDLAARKEAEFVEAEGMALPS